MNIIKNIDILFLNSVRKKIIKIEVENGQMKIKI